MSLDLAGYDLDSPGRLVMQGDQMPNFGDWNFSRSFEPQTHSIRVLLERRNAHDDARGQLRFTILGND